MKRKRAPNRQPKVTLHFCFFCAVATVLIGCGPAAPSSTTPTPPPAKTSQNDNWKTVTGSGGEVSLSVPEDWTPLDPSDKQIQDFAAEGGKKNPNIAISQDELKKIIENKAVKLFVFGPMDKEINFRPNVNVILVDNDNHETMDQIESELAQNMKSMGEVIEKSRVKIGGIDAAESQAKVQAGSLGTMIEDVYIVPVNPLVYELTFTIPEHLMPTMKTDVQRMASSFVAKKP